MLLVDAVPCFTLVAQVSAIFSTCRTGLECSSCPDDKVKSFLFRSGEETDVCCPDCSSQYISFGYTRIRESPYCNCDYARVQGSAGKGEECSAPGMTTYTSLNGMPICCADPLVVVQGVTYVSGDYVFNCEMRGDCWRGSQCDSCNQTTDSFQNDVSVCCPHCQMGDLHMDGDNYCYCHTSEDAETDALH